MYGLDVRMMMMMMPSLFVFGSEWVEVGSSRPLCLHSGRKKNKNEATQDHHMHSVVLVGFVCWGSLSSSQV